MPNLAFEYLEIRHCLFLDNDTLSFTDEAEFDLAAEALTEPAAEGWTLYGRYTDEAGQSLALAIADFDEKDDAFTVMNAILAPIATARDAIDEARRSFDLDDSGSRRAFLTAIADVGNDLTDFVAQSSDRERL